MRLTGIKGEELAVRFLRKKGYRILRKNFRSPVGEIDIIAEEGKTIVFVEVKTRTDDSFGHPFEAVDTRKKEKLRRAALSYLKQCKEELPSRFDVLSIEMDGGKSRIEHIIDAFE
ncbi:MAG TPA: YraN family protein [Thermodesulfovibrionales bacterium]|nr:YraN family protein [Thermodesulfovibrionales bacterium]